MVPTICTEKTYSHFPPHHLHKKTSLIHSDSTLWWQPSWILPFLILPSLIQPFCTKLRFKLIQFDSNSFIFIQLDDGSHLGFIHFAQKKLPLFILNQAEIGSLLEFYHLGFSHFAQKKISHSFWLNLMMAAILNSAMYDSDTAILDSDTLLSFHRFIQKHSHSNLTLTQTNSIWLKLIHSHLTWWWQPSSIWPSCFFLSYSLTLAKNGSHHLHKKNLLRFPSPPFAQKNFTHSFWLNLMKAAILNSAMLDSTILHKKLHLFILTQLDDGSHLEFGHFGFSHFAQKKHLSFILTQLDDGSHPELCHVGFRHCHLGFRHLVIFSQIHSKTLSLQSDSDSN